ncbi:MAG TPA: LysM peptidoglycan-binding domain-containing protein [Opitutaceae bacterium]|nr:LysM peptidoglycan-binding domain-containing protein [Opitutaceae bacterium]
MKIIKILGIAAAFHALALILIFSNPGCSYTKAAAPDTPPITPAPLGDASAPAASSETPTIRYSPTRPGTVVASALETQPVSGVTPATTYTVARGDNLWTIAKANQVSRTDLAAANKLSANAILHIGQKLIIPTKPMPSAGAAVAAPVGTAAAPATVGTSAGANPPEKAAGEAEKHVVKAGETLGGIARKYGVRQGDIAVANNITDPRRIQPGQELIIPARSTLAGKPPKGAKSRADAADAAKPAPAAPPGKAPVAAPGSDQDLDAGLKPPSAAEVPVVKIEDAPAAQPKNP